MMGEYELWVNMKLSIHHEPDGAHSPCPVPAGQLIDLVHRRTAAPVAAENRR